MLAAGRVMEMLLLLVLVLVLVLDGFDSFIIHSRIHVGRA